LAKKSETGSAKRYGTRYGRTLKIKLAKVEAQYRKKLSCPYCHYKQVRRVAMGIWKCEKCNAEFTASAYTIMKSRKEQPEEETTE
jgi:large subunit ribosomal protein L37Ae